MDQAKQLADPGLSPDPHVMPGTDVALAGELS